VIRFVAVVWTATAEPPPRRFGPAVGSLHPAVSQAHPMASADAARILYVDAMVLAPAEQSYSADADETPGAGSCWGGDMRVTFPTTLPLRVFLPV
jgi:hypothetical protein